ncbi:MAG: hypothetical protein HUK03_08700, partial [Bacteroidaceae bacterium]|nr:hypothetical protein [Bacteroidaceae bacterium]
ALMQFVLLAIAVAVCMYTYGWIRIAAATPILLLSMFLSLKVLGKDTHFLHKLWHKLTHKSHCDCCK